MLLWFILIAGTTDSGYARTKWMGYLADYGASPLVMDVVRRNMPLVIIGQDRISTGSSGGAKIHQLPLQFLATASL